MTWLKGKSPQRQCAGKCNKMHFPTLPDRRFLGGWLTDLQSFQSGDESQIWEGKRASCWQPCMKGGLRWRRCDGDMVVGVEEPQVRREGKKTRMLVTNSDLGCALRAPLPSYRLLSMRFAHDGEQSLQEHIQEALHHHFYLLHDICLLERARENTSLGPGTPTCSWPYLLRQLRQEWSSVHLTSMWGQETQGNSSERRCPGTVVGGSP